MRHAILGPILIVAIAVGCGTKSDPNSDTDGSITTPVTFSDDVDVILATQCSSCHSSSLSGGARNGAPSGLDWDVYSSAAAQSDRIFARASAGTMPPSGDDVPADEVAVLQAWDEQGAPE